ncbi:isoleucine--tRNA ligase [Patescibacteria group bacterium]|nr:isoleucine--tRNA ligase [Patescibacteria group bacterium]
MPYDASKNEKEILEFWRKDKTFEKSVEERPKDKPYVFYDGPPFATGLPHYGHIVASLIKDVVPRYFTMRGFRVDRVWGWDCHGLPIENIIEKELDLKTKEDIEKMGIEKFNEAARSKVLMYAKEWKITVERMGRWVDMDHAYRTMDIEYMESIWWVFRELWDKKLIYEGYKPMHICPRCVTPLSNFEVTQEYKDVTDLSVTARFKVKNSKEKFGIDANVYVLAWTTTPWTLPGNVLLAVGEKIEYSLVELEKEYYIVAKKRVQDVFKDKEFKVIEQMKGNKLIGLEYEPLFPYFADTENAFRVVQGGDFINTEEGTGVVHIAPAFGEDDYRVGLREKTGWVQHVTMDGKFTDEVVEFVGKKVKPKEDPTATDLEILKWLALQGKLFSKKKFLHSYPHCWRCDTPLLNYSTSSWFVNVEELKDDLIKNNKSINWVPEHIRDGRFGKWLEGAHDWAISRNRYWGTPLPIWKSEDDEIICIGSAKELEELTGEKVEDLHKHFIDKLVIKKEGKEFHRIPEVFDCWFESGSMPYGQMHYPFENKEKFEAGFPAEFIAEGQDQTRGWFYTLHILATALTRGKNPSIPVKKTTASFKNVIVNGMVLAEDGKKMSKRLQNYPDPNEVLEKYGADAMRYYLLSSPVMHAEGLNFSENEVREMFNKVVNTLWNVFEFYKMFAEEGTKSNKQKAKSDNVLDRWIMTKLHILVREVTEKMEEYKLAEASRPILNFITELSQWYVRRSRDRFKGDDEADKQNALSTLHEVLLTLSKVMAPFTPFIAEKIFEGTKNNEQGTSVHLEMWPGVDDKMIDDKLISDMGIVRKIVEMGHALRKEAGIAVRQPLTGLHVIGYGLRDELKVIIAEELNLKEIGDKVIGDKVVVREEGELKVSLDIEITDELKKEGLVREIVRAINNIRKEKKFTREHQVIVNYSTHNEILQTIFVEFAEEIKKSVLAVKVESGEGGEEVLIDGKKVLLSVEMV